MPLYEFECIDCTKIYEEFAKHDPKGKYRSVKCPHCGSKSKNRLMSSPSISFGDPKSSSKWDSFSYRAGHNLEKAKEERRYAESKSHMGSNPYGKNTDFDRFNEGVHDVDPFLGNA